MATHREALAVHVDGVRIDELAPPLVVVHIVAGQDFHVHSIQPIQLLQLVVHEALPGQSRARGIPPGDHPTPTPTKI